MNAASFQAEAVFNRHGFARTIAFVHSADLRNGGNDSSMTSRTSFDRFRQLRDRLSLIAARLVVRFELKRHPAKSHRALQAESARSNRDGVILLVNQGRCGKIRFP